MSEYKNCEKKNSYDFSDTLSTVKHTQKMMIKSLTNKIKYSFAFLIINQLINK